MDYKSTALVLIGYQNDYFAEDGILHGVIKESLEINHVLANTLSLIDHLSPTEATIISTPINFTKDYLELVHPVGILQTIKEVGAFRHGTSGAAVIPEILKYGDRIREVPGKRGLNAFSNTDLAGVLESKKIKTVILAGVVTSICIDSTGRDAFERGFEVIIMKDCTSGRTEEEQAIYCNSIFPVYSRVLTIADLKSEFAAVV